MYVVIGHHCCNDQGVAMGVMDEVCITFSESDVVVFPLELLCRPLVQVVDIGERPILCLPIITVLRPTCLPYKIRFAGDRPDLVWGLYFRSVILRPCPPIVDVILKVPAANELLYLVLEGDALLNGVTDVFMEPIILVLVLFRAVSM